MISRSNMKLKRHNDNSSNSRKLEEYMETLQNQLEEERDEKEALSIERAKLKVCWEMTLEELVSTRTELSQRITCLERELFKQLKRKKLLQHLLNDYGRNLEEMRAIIDHIINRPKVNMTREAEDTFAEEPK